MSYLLDQLGPELLLWVTVLDGKGTNHTRDPDEVYVDWSREQYPLQEILATITLGHLGHGYAIEADDLDRRRPYQTPTFKITGDEMLESDAIGRVQVAMEKARRAGIKGPPDSEVPALSEVVPAELTPAPRQADMPDVQVGGGGVHAPRSTEPFVNPFEQLGPDRRRGSARS